MIELFHMCKNNGNPDLVCENEPYYTFCGPPMAMFVYKRKMVRDTVDGWLRMGLPPPPPREFGRHILSCKKLKGDSFKKCLHSVRWGVSLSN